MLRPAREGAKRGEPSGAAAISGRVIDSRRAARHRRRDFDRSQLMAAPLVPAFFINEFVR